MAGYTVIADIGQYLIDMLRESMVPETVQNADTIALFASDGDFMLNLALYNIEILNRSFPQNGKTLPLALKYMLFVNSGANADMKAAAEQRILGKALSVLCERPIIRKENPFIGGDDAPAEITLENVMIDERVKVCEHLCGAFKTSVFLCVSPVFITTGIAFKAARVLNG